MNNLTVSFVDC